MLAAIAIVKKSSLSLRIADAVQRRRIRSLVASTSAAQFHRLERVVICAVT